MAAAVIGGTASVIGGGKFENGAMYGAFQYLYNAVGDRIRNGNGSKLTVRTEKDGDRTKVTISGKVYFVRYGANEVMDPNDPHVANWMNGIVSAWSGDKGLYDVTVDLEVLDVAAKDAIRIYVYNGSGQPHMNQLFMDSTGMDAAHEFGHDLGLKDLYRGSAGLYEEDMIYYPFRNTSIMGWYNKPSFSSVSEWDIQWAIQLNK